MTLFMSDCHLGNPRCQGEALCDFLARNKDHSTIYLVGDIVDNQQMFKWPRNHDQAFFALFDYERVIYIPGNHDSVFRGAIGNYGRLSIKTSAVYTASDDRTYLVTHGDQYDLLMKLEVVVPAWLQRRLYFLSHLHNYLASGVGFKSRVTRAAKEANASGVICGHNHVPEVSDLEGVQYINCGDWTTSCSAVVEKGGVFTVVN